MKSKTIAFGKSLLTLGVAAAGLSFLAGTPGTASAQDIIQSRPAPCLNTQFWRPAPMPGDYLTSYGTMVEEEWRVTGGFYLNYALNPVESPTGQSDTASTKSIVKNQTFLDLYASISMFKHLEVSLVLPFALHENSSISPIDDDDNPSDRHSVPVMLDGGTSGIGDMRLLLKGKILDLREWPVGLAVIGDISFPTAVSANDYRLIGDNGPTFTLIAALELNPWGMIRGAFNIGYRYRPKTNFYERYPGQALILSGGVAIPFFYDDLDFLVDLRGELNLNGGVNLGRDAYERPFEADMAFRYRFVHDQESWARNLSMTIGVGTGTNSLGVPDVRVFGGVNFHWVNGGALSIDAEYGGYITAVDPCPDPELTPASQIPDRCKNRVIDTDGDTIPDAEDACPFKGRVGFIDENGCPSDRDGDGVPDYEDLCPDQGIEVMGYVDKNGCPYKDSDGDGLYDHEDRCPYEGLEVSGRIDEMGCPIRDTDKDGIYDDVDKCPTEPEVYNGYEDEDGCPDSDPNAKVELSDGKINIKEQVFFETSKAIIKKESYDLLNQVAQLLIDNPHIGNITVEGHTDSRGKYKSNMKLSSDRANSVRKYLIKRGVDADRLTSVGYGPDRPIDTNDTAEGRARNRRVEFVVLGLPEDADTGSTHVTE